MIKGQPAKVNNILQNNTQTNVWEQSEWLLTKKNCRMQLKTPLDTFKLKCHQQYRLLWKTKQEDTTNFPKAATFTKPSTLTKMNIMWDKLISSRQPSSTPAVFTSDIASTMYKYRQHFDYSEWFKIFTMYDTKTSNGADKEEKCNNGHWFSSERIKTKIKNQI